MNVHSAPRRVFRARHRSWHRHSMGRASWNEWVGDARAPGDERIRGVAGWLVKVVLVLTLLVVAALCFR